MTKYDSPYGVISSGASKSGLSKGHAWGTIYDVDFRSLPQLSNINSSALIDGKRWWVKGNLGTSGVAAIVPGQGLKLGSYTANGQAYSIGDVHGIFMSFKEIKAYNRLAPVILQYWYSSVESRYPGNMSSNMSMFPCAENNNVILDSERMSGLTTCYDSENNGNRSRVLVRNGGQETYNYVETNYNQPVPMHVFTLFYPCVGAASYAFSDLKGPGGAWPALHTLNSTYTRIIGAAYPVPTPMGIAVSYTDGLGEFYGNCTQFIGGIRVMQPTA
jgi:hypothetical protein